MLTFKGKTYFLRRLLSPKGYLLIFIFFFCCLQACSAPRPSAQLTLALESEPGLLDPRYPGDAYSAKVRGLIYQGLLKWGKNLELIPDLAEAYEFLSPTEIKFKLRKGIFFQNGQPLSAWDVRATFMSILKAQSTSPYKGDLARLKEIKVLDDYQLIFKLKSPFQPFLNLLTLGIVPKEFAKAEAQDSPPGTGPFYLKSRLKDEWLRLIPFKKHLGKLPQINSLEIKIVKNDTTRALQLIKGEIDLLQNALPWPLLSWVKEKTDLSIQSAAGINYRYLAFNLKDPLLKDRTVRRAISMALDRPNLIKHYLAGYAREATGLLSPAHAYYEGEVLRSFYNPDLAKKLLDEAGYTDPDDDGPLKRFTLVYKTSTQREAVRLARAIVRSLEAVGIGVELKTYEWGTFYRDIRQGNFQIFTSTWVGVKGPDIYHYIFHSQSIPPKGGNRGHYKNPQVDTWLDEARVSFNFEERFKLYSKVQKQLAVDLPYVSLWWEDNVAVSSPELMGYELRPDASLEGLVGVKVED